MTKPAILFDLDGTLVDSAPDLIATLNHLLAQHDCPSAPQAQMRNMISLGARAMLKKGFELAEKPRNEAHLDALFKRFLTYYSAHIADFSQPFPGVLNALDQLKAAGHPLAICTNKTEKLARQLINALSMDACFDMIAGVDTLPHKKPHPGHLLGTLERLHVAPHNALMVGDSESDILAAKAARLPVIAVDFGYSLEPVQNFAPDAIISTHDDLLLTLSSFF